MFLLGFGVWLLGSLVCCCFVCFGVMFAVLFVLLCIMLLCLLIVGFYLF